MNRESRTKSQDKRQKTKELFFKKTMFETSNSSNLSNRNAVEIPLAGPLKLFKPFKLQSTN